MAVEIYLLYAEYLLSRYYYLIRNYFMEFINANPNNQGQAERVKVRTKEFAAKFSSKKEVYSFLCGQVKAYLAGYDSCSIYFLRSLVIGEKKCKQITVVTLICIDIKSDDICHLYCPHYEGLSIESIIAESKRYPNVQNYLPDGPDLARMPR